MIDLSRTISQMNLKGVYTIFYTIKRKWGFFFLSAAHGNISKVNQILGHKAHLIKYQKNDKITCILSDCNVIKLEINSNKNYRKHINMWKLNNIIIIITITSGGSSTSNSYSSSSSRYWTHRHFTLSYILSPGYILRQASPSYVGPH